MFKVNNVQLFLCANNAKEGCTVPKKAADGYWELRGDKVCPGCWDVYKGGLKFWTRRKYVFHCGDQSHHGVSTHRKTLDCCLNRKHLAAAGSDDLDDWKM